MRVKFVNEMGYFTDPTTPMKYEVVQCYALYLAILFHLAPRCEDSFDFEHEATRTEARTRRRRGGVTTLEDHRRRRRFHLFFLSGDAAAD